MHLEVVPALRCPRVHEASWLVARTDVLEARHILEGVLGCPVCGAEYPVRAGTALLGAPNRQAAEAAPDDAALRVAALLGLTTPGGLVALAGSWAAAAVEVATLADGVHLLAVNAPGVPPPAGLGVSSLAAAEILPLRAGVVRGIALDAGHSSGDGLRAAAEALSAGGRLLAPVSALVPDSLAELARDERWWVAEKSPAVPVVPLASQRRGPP